MSHGSRDGDATLTATGSECDEGREIRYLHRLPTEPPEEGYHRVVRTYDDLVPVCWADVPNGLRDPKPMYLSTNAAAIMMMSDEDFEEYLRLHPEAREDSPSERGRPSMARAIAPVLMSVLFMPVVALAPVPAGARIAASLAVIALGIVVASIRGVRFALANRNMAGQGHDDAPADKALAKAADGGTPAESAISEALRKQVRLPDVGWLAERGRIQAEALVTTESRTRKVVDASFAAETLSWSRFSGTVDMMRDTVLRHLSVLAEGIETFATEERISSSWTHKKVSSDTQRVREFTELVTPLLDDNDTLLAEMENLEAELMHLRYENLSEDSEQAIDEARRIVDDVRYYKG